MNTEKKACSCCGVTYRDIATAGAAGASTYEEVSAVTRCGKGCGRCQEFIRHFVAELVREKQQKE